MAIDINRNYKDNFIEDERVAKQRARTELEKQMAEFLAKGGAVQRLEPGIAKGASSLSYSGKLQYSDADIKRQAREQNGHTGSKETGGDRQ
jgi:hypothetical protein